MLLGCCSHKRENENRPKGKCPRDVFTLYNSVLILYSPVKLGFLKGLILNGNFIPLKGTTNVPKFGTRNSCRNRNLDVGYLNISKNYC